MKVLIFIIASTLSSHAAVIKNDVTGLKREVFSLKQACEKTGFIHLLLVEAKNATTVECMGRDLKALDFCQKIEGRAPFLRGFVSASTSQVFCEYGESVSLSLSCDQEHYGFCQNAKKGCDELRNSFAQKLELLHSSLTGIPKNLNCHYSVSVDPLNPTL